MVKVYSARDLMDAELIRSMLESNGIPAVVQGTALWGGRGELPLTLDTAPSVWIADQTGYDRARALITEFQTPASPRRCPNCDHDVQGQTEPRCPNCGQALEVTEPWICPDCGELIEGEFAACWRCAGNDPDLDPTE